MERIYAIIRKGKKNLELKSFPIVLDHSPTNKELCQEFDYAVNLVGPYTSYLPSIKDDELLWCSKQDRCDALAFKQSQSKILKENDVVAISHRNGGWTTFKWKYNKDISFEIFSNFGFGRCSELISRFYYKDLILTPYSDYIKYRFAGFSQLIRYTFKYELKYSEWETLMNDTLSFYNALCKNKENEVIKWVICHLDKMTEGLYALSKENDCFKFTCSDGSLEEVSGDELELVKAEKLLGSIDFLKNIKSLSKHVHPRKYILKIRNILREYLDYAPFKIKEYERIIDTLNYQIEQLNNRQIVTIYERLNRIIYPEGSKKENKIVIIKLIRKVYRLNDNLKTPMSKQEIRHTLKKYDEMINNIYDKIFNKTIERNKLIKYKSQIEKAYLKINTFMKSKDK